MLAIRLHGSFLSCVINNENAKASRRRGVVEANKNVSAVFTPAVVLVVVAQ